MLAVDQGGGVVVLGVPHHFDVDAGQLEAEFDAAVAGAERRDAGWAHCSST